MSSPARTRRSIVGVALGMIVALLIGSALVVRAALSAPPEAATVRMAPRPPSSAAGAGTPKPATLVSVRSNLGSGQEYGIGAPVVLTFSHPVPKADRAAVQKRLSVISTPAQLGTWNWLSGREVHYRPKAYWHPGTKLTVVARTGGVPMGAGYAGRNDLVVDTSITTEPLSIVVDAQTHLATVKRNGVVVRRMPASLGKTSTPSSSGNMVIMSRRTDEIFDSSLGGGTPVDAPGGYRLRVHWTMRLTWSGEYIHAAPWSVNDQGVRNVSHGCTNLSTADAKWIYENSHVGDPVRVTGTPRSLGWGNGWTDWNVSWATYVKGSALPLNGNARIL